MMDIGELFARTWTSYTKRLLPLLGLYLIASLVSVFAAGVFAVTGLILAGLLESMRPGIFIGTAVVSVTAGLIAMGWGYGAFFFAASDETMGFGEALKRSWQRVGSFIWVLVLYAVIRSGGYALFLLPGILFWVWFHFTFFVFAKEGLGGMDAFLKSKAYVKGNFWGVFARLFIIWLIPIGMVSVPFIGSILMLLYVPFATLFVYNMYADLRARKGKVEYSASPAQRVLYPALGLLGLVAIPIVLVLMGVTAFLTSLAMEMQTQMPFGP